MLTTEAQPELVQQAKQAGAKAWIIKPFKHDCSSLSSADSLAKARDDEQVRSPRTPAFSAKTRRWPTARS